MYFVWSLLLCENYSNCYKFSKGFTNFQAALYIIFSVNKIKATTTTLLGYIFTFLHFYAFSRRFYPKRLTVHSGYTLFCQYVFPGNWTHNLCAANAMLYHWATTHSGVSCLQVWKFEIHHLSSLVLISGSQLYFAVHNCLCCKKKQI